MTSQIYLVHRESRESVFDYYELTCTTDISISKRNSVSDVPVEAGFVVSDNSFIEPTMFSIRGVLTDVKNVSLDYHRPADEVIKKISALMDEGAVFTLSLDDTLDIYENVVITSFIVDKRSGMGESWSVNLDLKQVIITNKAKRVTFPPQDDDIENQSKGLSRQGDNNTEEQPLRSTLLLSTGRDLSEFFFPYSGG